jgi:PST family polysaccharide transporter
MLPASVIFYLLAADIVRVVLGQRWETAILPFQILALGLLFRTSCRMSDALARAKGCVYRRAWRQGVYAGLVIGGAIVGQNWGLAGAAAGVLIALSVNFLLMAELSLRIAGMGWSSFLGAHLPAILLAISLGTTLRVASFAANYLSFPPVATLVGSVALAGCTALALAFLFPKFFLGQDGLWMLHTLREQFAPLRRLPVPCS